MESVTRKSRQRWQRQERSGMGPSPGHGEAVGGTRGRGAAGVSGHCKLKEHWGHWRGGQAQVSSMTQCDVNSLTICRLAGEHANDDINAFVKKMHQMYGVRIVCLSSYTDSKGKAQVSVSVWPHFGYIYCLLMRSIDTRQHRSAPNSANNSQNGRRQRML